jgi:pimeloyl-ACP methyl ester carboxylesterase
MKDKKISYQDSMIHYSVSGQGAPVVLLHGFAEDGTIWERQARYLESRYQLIIPDIPGSGKSNLIINGHVGLEAYAEVIKEIITAEGISKFTMIGHSMGGYITLAYQEKYPHDLRAFGLFHSSAFADDSAKTESRKKAIEFIKTNGAAAFLKTSIPGLFSDPVKSQDDISQLLEKGNAFSSEALIQYYEAMIARPDRTFILQKATVPVLFVGGQHDKAVPINHTLQQTHLPPVAYLHVLRESAHIGMLEETGLSNEILANFLHSIDN